MRKYRIIIMLLVMSVVCVKAQTYNSTVGLGVGWLYERGLEATLSYEKEGKYRNSWEYFLNGYVKYDKQYPDAAKGESFSPHYTMKSVWEGYRTWAVGIAYKPCVSRGMNKHKNLRLGTSVGSNTDRFLIGVHAGYENSYALRNGVQLYWQVKCDCLLPRRGDLFRTGVVLGMKLPTQKR